MKLLLILYYVPFSAKELNTFILFYNYISHGYWVLIPCLGFG